MSAPSSLFGILLISLLGLLIPSLARLPSFPFSATKKFSSSGSSTPLSHEPSCSEICPRYWLLHLLLRILIPTCQIQTSVLHDRDNIEQAHLYEPHEQSCCSIFHQTSSSDSQKTLCEHNFVRHFVEHVDGIYYFSYFSFCNGRTSSRKCRSLATFTEMAGRHAACSLINVLLEAC